MIDSNDLLIIVIRLICKVSEVWKLTLNIFTRLDKLLFPIRFQNCSSKENHSFVLTDPPAIRVIVPGILFYMERSPSETVLPL